MQAQDFKVWVKDTAERSASTFVQAAITYVVTSGALNMSMTSSIAAAGITAAMVVLKQAVFATRPPIFENLWADMISRAGWSGLQVGLTMATVVGFGWADLSSWQAVAVGAGTAALTVVKSFLADRFVGNTLSPASVAVGPSIAVVPSHGALPAAA